MALPSYVNNDGRSDGRLDEVVILKRSHFSVCRSTNPSTVRYEQVDGSVDGQKNSCRLNADQSTTVLL